jgi:transcription initiation factor TFIID subunit 11
MGIVLSQLTPEQLVRYEHFRRSHFSRAAVKRVMRFARFDCSDCLQLMTDVSNERISEQMVIVMSGMTKMFVGEMVESGTICF